MTDIPEVCTCGMCRYAPGEKDAERCSICLRFRCRGEQAGLRRPGACTVCPGCVRESVRAGQLPRIFVDGKNRKGEWIDPARKTGVRTCRCGLPWSQVCGLRWVSAVSQGQADPPHRPL